MDLENLSYVSMLGTKYPLRNITLQNMKYLCAKGNLVAGKQVKCTPSAVTLYVSGSTRNSGQVVFNFMSVFPIFLVPCTANIGFTSP